MSVKKLALIGTLLFVLSGCETIGNWADSIGEHLPVIGERCEHWQCFTASGQQASEEAREKHDAVAAPTTPVAQAPIPSAHPVNDAGPQ